MKKLFLLAVLAFFCAINTISAQYMTFSYYAGYGSYQMGDMKNLLEESLKELPVDGKIINNFPGYFNQTIQLGYSSKEHYFGLEYGLMSTGGKVGYSDYSGNINMEMNLKADKLGLYYKFHFYNQKIQKNWVSVFTAVSSGVIFSDLEVEERLYIPSTQEIINEDIDISGNAKFSATNFYILPQLGAGFRLSKYFSIQLAVGYEFGINQNMTLKSGNYTDQSGTQPIEIGEAETNSIMDWSGFRANAGITLFLPVKKMN